MKRLPKILPLILCLGLCSPVFAQDRPEVGPKKPGGSQKGGPRPPDHKKDKDGRPDAPDLSPEDMRKVRDVMGKVWDDPKVVEAREQWRLAGEAYRKTLKTAVIEADPAVAELMDKMHEGSRVRAHQKMHPGGGFGPGWPPSREELVSRLTKSDPVMELITAEQQIELTGLVQQLLKSGKLNDEIAAVLKSENPKDHVPARIKLREAMVKALSAEADWIKEAFEKAPPPSERMMRGPGGPPKGKGGKGPGQNNGGERPKRPETD
ncbi:MAG: hypothetical protein ACI8UO_002292 [Verrucomicrobiales bacterium]|jgi:hypothetical protein